MSRWPPTRTLCDRRPMDFWCQMNLDYMRQTQRAHVCVCVYVCVLLAAVATAHPDNDHISKVIL